MRREKFLEVFDNLPTKRKQVLLGILRGDTREKIMAEVGVSPDALTQHRRQLYKDFKIEGLQNEADDPRSGERKLPLLIALCAQYQPDLISPNTDRISPPSSESLLFPNFSTYNPQTWVGRESIVEELLPKLQGQTRLLWIKGISGIGKTTLGECLASKTWEKERSFEWIYLEILEGQSPDFASVVAELLAKLGDRELDPQERNNPDRLAKRLLQKLQSHSYWIQIDSLERLLNPEQPNEFVDTYWATFLQRFLTESGLVSHLVLTAQALPTALVEFSDRYPNTWAEYRLNGLLQLEQLEFFAKRGVIVEPSNQDILTRIAKIYEGHPLVLKVIAEDILKEFAGDVSRYWQIYQPEFEQVARELQATRLDETEYNEALDRKVRQRIKKSLEKLPADALDLLCRSAVFRRPVPKKFWLAMIGDRSSQQQQVAYRVLGDRALIEKEGTDIRQHNLIRAISYDLLKANLTTWETAERQAAHLWLTVYEPATNAPKLETVRGYLEAFDHYCEVRDWEAAKTILLDQQIGLQLHTWGNYQEILTRYHPLIDRLSATDKVTCRRELGHAYLSLCNYSQAIHYCKQSLNLAQEIGDRLREGKALNNLGFTYDRLGEYQQAIDFYQQGLTIAREISDPLGEGNTLGNLGIAYYRLGEYQQASSFYQQHLILAREIGHRLGESNSLGNLGLVYYKLGEYNQAINLYQQHLILAREIGHRLGEGNTLSNLGLVYYKLGEYKQAIDLYQQHLILAREIEDRLGEGNALNHLGETQIKLEQYPESMEKLNRALEIFREISARRNKAEVLKNLAELHQAMGEFDVARQYCQQALALATELGIPLVAECEALQLKIENEKLKMEETQA
ncbi:MAG: tetratricopeptide repeat protein [Microcoleus sp. PH2017_15_JOR_U_A]|uniref:tetratricopeptide repeat protein n=1 Tax=unclassified Microcoleus TaxID=2642155 RepID=UPI001D209EA8|nr:MULTISPECIES: tetratricopeptide repeat protein [unclassified Microcoleus]MCC3473502.1 tetratricopeptide repeat protein [Microcoleus sp. PH2017_13_LAR_U_A]MCC3485891.1 tetratricopeptide repeat protein [Microcoleus sp. PH2017_14_LAR_D_A]MCC3497529.1 tetratricopeptide repeat protein [Microcoleus sp. PH2017_15_JOR_U_A]MCC3598417.1 tetratricopeptide repeat protein [Microcoleus sp. PH2017_26_ELK_O_A]MCC3623486.1 tetratricopeptide repeat protein [Microcoleus sp. PH2017_36_ELK_O_B]